MQQEQQQEHQTNANELKSEVLLFVKEEILDWNQ